MSQNRKPKPDYANWVSLKFIYIPFALSVLFCGLSIVSWWSLILAFAFLGFSIYFLYARNVFSPHGGDVQAKIQASIIEHLDWGGAGEVLDVGCGSGSLTISIAKAHPEARVTGIDTWGKSWDYSKDVCESNASIEGVADRTTFERADARSLPFKDNSFDVVVSNLVYHETAGVKDKATLIKETLRVLKEGGRFVLQDLFLWKTVFGDVDDLLDRIRSWQLAMVELIPMNNAEYIPPALKLPFMVGTIAIVRGVK